MAAVTIALSEFSATGFPLFCYAPDLQRALQRIIPDTPENRENATHTHPEV